MSDEVVTAALEAPVKTPRPATVVDDVPAVRTVRYYDPGWSFGLGYLLGWGLHGHHHHHWHGGVRAGGRW